MAKKGKRKMQPRSVKRIRRIRLFIAVMVVILILVAGSLAVRIFGGVDMSSSDVDYTSDQATSARSSANTDSSKAATAQSQMSTTSTTSKATINSAVGYVQPAGAPWNLKLVNKWNPLNKDYPQSLETYEGGNKFDNRAMDDLKELITAGSRYKIGVISLYRTIELQTKLFNNEVNEHLSKGRSQAQAEEIASTVVARPGTSEHNLGLAVDLRFGGYPDLAQSNANTAAYEWLTRHCADYGFILRYPKDKVSVTGVTFEPWHYRY
ncbi:MAG: M15 family metallopeptidase, partial [Oscillospiraceae bacterium]|nr:M15 family metallopeptidase [Oscillospiraceae bacterium]